MAHKESRATDSSDIATVTTVLGEIAPDGLPVVDPDAAGGRWRS